MGLFGAFIPPRFVIVCLCVLLDYNDTLDINSTTLSAPLPVVGQVMRGELSNDKIINIYCVGDLVESQNAPIPKSKIKGGKGGYTNGSYLWEA